MKGLGQRRAVWHGRCRDRGTTKFATTSCTPVGNEADLIQKARTPCRAYNRMRIGRKLLSADIVDRREAA